jgi:hypothetical protein
LTEALLALLIEGGHFSHERSISRLDQRPDVPRVRGCPARVHLDDIRVCSGDGISSGFGIPGGIRACATRSERRQQANSDEQCDK